MNYANKPKKSHPRIESDKLYRVSHTDSDTCKLVEATIVKQGGGKITYKIFNKHEIEKRTKDLIEEGAGGTAEEAIARYLRYYEEQVAAATRQMQRAARVFTHTDARLTEAKNRIEVMLQRKE